MYTLGYLFAISNEINLLSNNNKRYNKHWPSVCKIWTPIRPSGTVHHFCKIGILRLSNAVFPIFLYWKSAFHTVFCDFVTLEKCMSVYWLCIEIQTTFKINIEICKIFKLKLNARKYNILEIYSDYHYYILNIHCHIQNINFWTPSWMLIITGLFFKFSCCLGAGIAKQCTTTERKKASFDRYCCHWIVIANEISF